MTRIIPPINDFSEGPKGLAAPVEPELDPESESESEPDEPEVDDEEGVLVSIGKILFVHRNAGCGKYC